VGSFGRRWVGSSSPPRKCRSLAAAFSYVEVAFVSPRPPSTRGRVLSSLFGHKHVLVCPVSRWSLFISALLGAPYYRLPMRIEAISPPWPPTAQVTQWGTNLVDNVARRSERTRVESALASTIRCAVCGCEARVPLPCMEAYTCALQWAGRGSHG
jgi:hypothetical protein